MNTTYLLIELIVLVVTISGFCWFVKTNHEAGLAVGMVNLVASIVLFGIGFASPLGDTIVTPTTQFTIERTPYRIVITALGQEVTFKDAYSVGNADKITSVNRTVQRNAWGIEMTQVPHQPTLTPVFGGIK